MKRTVLISFTILSLLSKLLLMGVVFNIYPVKADWTWTVTIYIRADGSVDPDTAPISTFDNITYTLTDNIVGDVPKFNEAIEVGRSNIVLDGKGYTLQGRGAYDSSGIKLDYVSNVTIKNVEIKAFYAGIEIYESSNNSMYANNLIENHHGICLNNPSGGNGDHMNTILGNNITDNECGIFVARGSNNTIYGNNITRNYCGILIESWWGSNNKIIGNNITSNDFGISLKDDNRAAIYHNYFVDNTEHALNSYYRWTPNGTKGPYFWHNVWDDGYPSGGNYWSDYSGVDVKSGPYQNETSSDGIGDTPYDIDDDNRDRYPIMSPWGEIPFKDEAPLWMHWWFWTIVAVGIVALAGVGYFLKKRTPPKPAVSSEDTVQNLTKTVIH